MSQVFQDQRGKRGNAHFEIEAPFPELPRKRVRYDEAMGALPISPVLSAVQHSGNVPEHTPVDTYSQEVMTPAVSPASMQAAYQQQLLQHQTFGDNDIYSEAEEYMVMGYYHNDDQSIAPPPLPQQAPPHPHSQSTSPSPSSSNSNLPIHYHNNNTTADFRGMSIQQTAAPYSLYDLTNEEIEMMNIQQQQQIYMQDEQMQY